MSSEIFKPVIGFTGFYEVSNLGRIKSLSHEIKANSSGSRRFTLAKIKEPSRGGGGNGGYMVVMLYMENKPHIRYVHRLVAEAFIPNPMKLKTVNHKDGIKSHNSVDNLEWLTYADNNRHARRTGLCKGIPGNKVEQVTLDGVLVATFKNACVASRETGVTRSQIQECCKPFRDGSGHTAGGFRWRYPVPDI